MALDRKPCIDSVGHLFALEPAEGGILHNKEPTIIPTESYGTHRVLRQVIAQFQFGIFQEARALSELWPARVSSVELSTLNFDCLESAETK